MLEFFGFAPDPRIPEGAYSWQHLTFVGSLIVIMIALAAWLGIKNKSKPFKDKNRILIVTALLADFLELLRIVILCLQSDNPDRWMYELPLFLCGLTLVALPIAAFTKGRVQDAALDFVAMFGILGAVMGTIGAAQNYNAYPVLSFLNVVSGLTHTHFGVWLAVYPVCENDQNESQELMAHHRHPACILRRFVRGEPAH